MENGFAPNNKKLDTITTTINNQLRGLAAPTVQARQLIRNEMIQCQDLASLREAEDDLNLDDLRSHREGKRSFYLSLFFFCWLLG